MSVGLRTYGNLDDGLGLRASCRAEALEGASSAKTDGGTSWGAANFYEPVGAALTYLGLIWFLP